MMASVSGRDRRALLVGTAAMALIAGARPLASSGTRWAVNTREERAALEGKLATEEASVRRAGTARDSLVARRVRLAALDTMLFKAATPGLAAAMLAERLTDAAQSSKAQMSNLQLRSDSTRVQALVPVQVQASVMGDWPAVARFLAQLESGSKLLAVRELTMTSLAASGGVAGQRPGVRADLVVEGLARIEPQPVARR